MAKDKGWSKKTGKCLVLGMTMVLGLSSYQAVNASSLLDNARNKKSEAESQLSSTNSQISQIERGQMQLRSEIQALDGQLVDVIVNLNILKNDLQAKEDELVQVRADLDQAKVDEENQFETMKKRIQFMYERGDSAFIASILDAGSFSEFLNRVEFYNDIHEYDRELLFAYQDAKDRVIELEAQVQGTIAEMGQIKLNQEEEQRQFEAMIAERRSQSATFDSTLAAAQALASQYQATIQEQNRIIREEQERIAREEAERRERERQERLAAEAEATRRQQAESARQAEQARRVREEERQAEATRQAEQARRAQASEPARQANNANTAPARNNTAPASNSSTTASSEPPASNSGGNPSPAAPSGAGGAAVVSYAMQFVGNRYVFGGSDPHTGADCSGFTQYVFRQFGVHLPRTDSAQMSSGRAVSYAEAQPGDLLFYGGHVAIYIGNGQIVHASNSQPYPAGGIKTGSATYRTIIAVRRVL